LIQKVPKKSRLVKNLAQIILLAVPINRDSFRASDNVFLLNASQNNFLTPFFKGQTKKSNYKRFGQS